MKNKKPNVIFVITDDQGYGDLGCCGNSLINTPNIDAFSKKSVNLEDYHVAPLCAPTRGEIMTGRRSIRNGVWATCWGRSILAPGERTIAECFKDNGYRTGMFGKWHLGDNYPYRPMDRGFERVVAHKGGGVGQTPDFWGNNYFDDTYFKNDKPTKFSGYCTDVWFEEAEKFINNSEDNPFFAYIATNAPHSPYLVDKKYSDKYQNNDKIPYPEFYGMIENIDENFGKLCKFLKEKNLEDNTIIIFTTDNGSSGCGDEDEKGFIINGFNAGMRGKKMSYYEGGHRVPLFMRWPKGGIDSYKKVNSLCFGIDWFPTFVELCGLNKEDVEFDGIDITNLLQSDKDEYDKPRIGFTQIYQNTNIPPKWSNAVFKDSWRLVEGKELFDIQKDPGEEIDIASEHPQLVEEMRSDFDKWWDSQKNNIRAYSPIYLGCKEENPTKLDSMDVMGDVAWNQVMVANAVRSAGVWCVKICSQGSYEFRLSRWPKELMKSLNSNLNEEERKILAHKDELIENQSLEIVGAVISINNKEFKIDVENNEEKELIIRADLEECETTTLKADFVLKNGEKIGVYYVYITNLDCEISV